MLLIFDNEMLINYPSGNPVKRIGKISDPETGEQVYDYALLSAFLQQLKLSLKDTGVDKKDIFILSQQNMGTKTTNGKTKQNIIIKKICKQENSVFTFETFLVLQALQYTSWGSIDSFNSS